MLDIDRKDCLTRAAFAQVGEDALIAFQPGTAQLAAGDTVWLRRWVETWFPLAPDALVVMGCVGVHAQEERDAGLRQLREALAGCGVARQRIWCVGHELAIPAVTGTAWLKAVRPKDAEPDPESLRSLFEKPN